MRHWIDLSKKEQRELRSEYESKNSAILDKFMMGSCALAIFLFITGVLAENGSISTITGIYIFIPLIYSIKDKSDFKKWLYTRNIMK